MIAVDSLALAPRSKRLHLAFQVIREQPVGDARAQPGQHPQKTLPALADVLPGGLFRWHHISKRGLQQHAVV
jgi:hypothetical protein